MTYVFSAFNNCFFEKTNLSAYNKAGWNTKDIIDIFDEIFLEYTNPPEGRIRVVIDGMPAWDDVTAPTTEELITVAEITDQFCTGIGQRDTAKTANWTRAD